MTEKAEPAPLLFSIPPSLPNLALGDGLIISTFESHNFVDNSLKMADFLVASKIKLKTFLETCTNPQPALIHTLIGVFKYSLFCSEPFLYSLQKRVNDLLEEQNGEDNEITKESYTKMFHKYYSDLFDLFVKADELHTSCEDQYLSLRTEMQQSVNDLLEKHMNKNAPIFTI